MSKQGSDNGDYQLITPPNRLKEKVGSGSAGSGFDPDLLSRAEKAISGLKEDFESEVLVAATRLHKLAGDLNADRSRAEKIRNKVFEIGHDVGGQGATFGYDLVTEIGLSLCGYIDRIEWAGDLNADVMTAHADALRAVVGNQVNGDGGEVGAELVRGLHELVLRMTD